MQKKKKCIKTRVPKKRKKCIAVRFLNLRKNHEKKIDIIRVRYQFTNIDNKTSKSNSDKTSFLSRN